MSFKSSARIRQEFMDFFAEKSHAITPSAPVVPKDDPSLLFTNAGMNQFKPIFLGDQKSYQQDGKQWQRAANSQRCIRVSGKHNDLEEVGIDTYHHTLFEMLGNWSFGDYFKKEAIGWSWELLVKQWGLSPDRLYATVFGGDSDDGLPVDDEAIALWESETGIARDHILKFGKEDNFWEMGETGPCGPCSEVHIDLRSDEERAQQPGSELVNADDPRVMEIWNLVFIQFNRQPDSSLESLPAQHVDTGMGFERICAVLQGKKSNYDSDVFTPLLDEISRMSGISYGKELQSDIAMRVIADHIRAVSFGITDGASPSNDGRGYVIRRILRRAVRYGWDVLGMKQPFMHKLAPVLAEQFKDVFPELHGQLDYVTSVIKAEEDSFLRTLGQGIQLFNQVAEGSKLISGDDAFKLHDTYGFPIDLTKLMARERGLEVDEDRFETLMQAQKQRGREAGRFSASAAEGQAFSWLTDGDLPESGRFVGYDGLEASARIIAYRPYDNPDKQGAAGQLILDRTPFYAESGGQVADTGHIILHDDTRLRVQDVQKKDGWHLHEVNALPDAAVLEKGSPVAVSARVEASSRNETQKHHSATHLLHAALRGRLGTHVAQKGSLVNEQKLRFDFSHYEAPDAETLNQIEAEVNAKVQANIPLVEERDVPIDEAKKRGAMMLFGEKYGDKVRIITFDPDYSVELCGGTHVQATGEIGYFRITSEASVASGIRRIEAVAGRTADKLLRGEKQELHALRKFTGAEQSPSAYVQELQQQKKALEKQLQEMEMKAAQSALKDLLSKGESISEGITLISGEVPGADMNRLKQLGYDSLQQHTEGTVTLLGARDEEKGKVYLMASVTDDLIKKGLKAGALVGKVAKIVGGGGGGQPNLATAGGRHPEKLNEAFTQAPELILEQMSS
jgi:alanyl-tRNA synthetase